MPLLDCNDISRDPSKMNLRDYVKVPHFMQVIFSQNFFDMQTEIWSYDILVWTLRILVPALVAVYMFQPGVFLRLCTKVIEYWRYYTDLGQSRAVISNRHSSRSEQSHPTFKVEECIDEELSDAVVDVVVAQVSFPRDIMLAARRSTSSQCQLMKVFSFGERDESTWHKRLYSHTV